MPINATYQLIYNSKCEKFVGVKFDYKLIFNSHIAYLCKSASRKINALARVTPYMSILKHSILMNAFFKSQFNFCPLAWMNHSRINNTKINRLREKCLRIIYNSKTLFENHLEKDGSVSIHNRNLLVLATEMFKINRGISSSIMKGVFEPRVFHG